MCVGFMDEELNIVWVLNYDFVFFICNKDGLLLPNPLAVFEGA